MELAAKNIIFFHSSRNGNPILGYCRQRILASNRKKGMDKIHIFRVYRIGKQLGLCLGNGQAVPTHVGGLKSFGQPLCHGHYLSFQKAQTFMLAILEAFLKQKLHTQANTHQRNAFCRLVVDKFVQTGLPKLFRGITKSTHTGQHQLIRLCKFFGITGHKCFHTNGFKGGLQRKQVSYPIVNDANHHRTPLVEGMASAAAASMATAAFKDRATDLKVPSTMWWELVPAS